MSAPYIFVSYRRGADQAAAGRVADRLRREFGPDRVFLDVEQNVELLSRRFKDVLVSKVEQCTDFIALIGSDWVDQVPNLQDQKDWIRLETSLALERAGIRFFPLLVDEAQMPSAEELPKSLKALPEIGGTRVRHDQFQDDLDPVVNYIRTAQKAVDDGGHTSESTNREFLIAARNWFGKVVVGVVLISAIGGGIAYYNNEEFRDGVQCYFTQEHVLVPC